MTENMSVASLVAVIVSLLLEWFPGLKTWWDKFSESQKRGMMAGAVAVLSIGLVALNCWRGVVCPEDWWATVWEIVVVFLTAATVQQGVHRLLKRSS